MAPSQIHLPPPQGVDPKLLPNAARVDERKEYDVIEAKRANPSDAEVIRLIIELEPKHSITQKRNRAGHGTPKPGVW